MIQNISVPIQIYKAFMHAFKIDHASLDVFVSALSFSSSNAFPSMHETGLMAQSNCTWCASGKYQTGVGLIAEVNCTWCIAGKYQTGSGSYDLWLISMLKPFMLLA